MPDEKTIHVYVEGGVVQDVTNLPEGWNWELHDADNDGFDEDEDLPISEDI